MDSYVIIYTYIYLFALVLMVRSLPSSMKHVHFTTILRYWKSPKREGWPIISWSRSALSWG